MLLLDELKRCRDDMNELFELLCFGHGRGVLPWGYVSGEAPDIERLLALIAQNSPLLQMPEAEPEVWITYRESIDETELAKLNKYRRKFGLCELQ
jgi:hypothetical protein